MLTAFVTALFAVSALAIPVEEASGKQGFIVEQQLVGKKWKNGPNEVLKTFRKYGKEPPSPVVLAAAAVQSGKATATPIDSYDDAYAAIVNIGSPAQNLPLDFDTGSSDLWVESTLQPATQQDGEALYNPSKSTSSSLESGETWDISYGDGSGAMGVVYTDKVVIGGATVASQAVEAATSASSEFTSDTAISGLVGLGFDNINTCFPQQCKTFMDNIASSLPSPLFTANLMHQAPGYYTFGYLDSTQYSGTIYYTPVSQSNGYWQITATGYSVGTSSTKAKLSTIVDTGTTLIYMPNAVVKKYYKQVSGASYSSAAGGYVFPCSATLPSFSVTVGGSSRTVPGSYINYAPYSGNTCFGGIQSSQGLGINILGDVFIKSQFVVFDYGGSRLGVASKS